MKEKKPAFNIPRRRSIAGAKILNETRERMKERERAIWPAPPGGRHNANQNKTRKITSIKLSGRKEKKCQTATAIDYTSHAKYNSKKCAFILNRKCVAFSRLFDLLCVCDARGSAKSTKEKTQIFINEANTVFAVYSFVHSEFNWIRNALFART